jgi:hypothetical protein
MATNLSIARNDMSRAFLFPNGVGACGIKPVYFSCLGVDSLSQDFGDVTRIECPDPYRYGNFIEVDTVPGEVSRLTTTLTTRMSRNTLSTFRNLSTKGCGFDFHLHFGLCTNPTAFNQYDKAMVFEDVYITSYGTDPLVALSSGDRAEINETIDISVGNFYEIAPLTYLERAIAQTALTTPLIDSQYVDAKNCGSCGSPSDGCQVAMAISESGDLLVTLDGGNSWTESTVTWGTTPAGIGNFNGYVWAYDGTVPNIQINTMDGINANTPNTLVTNNVIAGGVDQDNGITYGLVVGTGGMIGVLVCADCGFDTSYVGVFTTEDLGVVNFAQGSDRALIGGANNTLIYTGDGENFAVVPTPAAQAGLTITAVYPVSDQHFLIGYADGGEIWCTDDFGNTWSQIHCTGITLGADITDIAFSSRHVAWATAGDQLWRSIDGGATFVLQPQSKKVFPVNTLLSDILVCPDTVNKVTVVGEDGGAGMIADGLPD